MFSNECSVFTTLIQMFLACASVDQSSRQQIGAAGGGGGITGRIECEPSSNGMAPHGGMATSSYHEAVRFMYIRLAGQMKTLVEG